MTKLRTLMAVGLAAGTFGGTVGALAASAVQSDASAGAIAAAVQRVSDSRAEQALNAVNGHLATLDGHLTTLDNHLKQADGARHSDDQALFNVMDAVCRNTESSVSSCFWTFPGAHLFYGTRATAQHGPGR